MKRVANQPLMVVQVLLILGLGLSGLVVLSVLLGTNGLGHYLPNHLVPGAAREMIGVDDAPLDTPVELPEGPRWVDTADGTMDAATGLGAIEITGPYRGRVSLWQPTAADRLAYLATRMLPPVLVLGVLALLLRIVRSLSAGDPFTAANVRRLRWLAVLVGVGGLAVALGVDLLQAWLLEHSAAASYTSVEATLPFGPIVAGVLIGLLAEVWAYGVRLRDDVEGLV